MISIGADCLIQEKMTYLIGENNQLIINLFLGKDMFI